MGERCETAPRSRSPVGGQNVLIGIKKQQALRRRYGVKVAIGLDHKADALVGVSSIGIEREVVVGIAVLNKGDLLWGTKQINQVSQRIAIAIRISKLEADF